ncbi:7765_t:CDS:2 [Entrophospora sp. SA101]|nr:7765_t:CDS:2 [Entrophospora sp. SA101]
MYCHKELINGGKKNKECLKNKLIEELDISETTKKQYFVCNEIERIVRLHHKRYYFENKFRNQYDNDISTWSPQGRIHQVEYALEAVKQGSAAVGLRSKTHAVLLVLKRSTGELASYQKKIIRIDDHMGIAIAGLTSDARVLSNFMRTEAMKSKMIYNRPLPIYRIVSAIGDSVK